MQTCFQMLIKFQLAYMRFTWLESEQRYSGACEDNTQQSYRYIVTWMYVPYQICTFTHILKGEQ